MEKKYISEEMNVQDEWYLAAQKMQTPEGLMGLIHHLMLDYSHDMNTVAHAVTAGALATISVMNRYPEGGLTSAQAQKVLTLFIRKWAKMEGPAKLWSWAGLLHPANEPMVMEIPKDVADWLTAQAREMLEKGSFMDDGHKQHLENILAGGFPWGFRMGK
jgi:hypothetical protein